MTQEGFLSTSKNKKLALQFADPTDDVNKIGVLLTLEIKQKKNFYIYDKNDAEYINEEEVLFNEGLKFKLKSVKL